MAGIIKNQILKHLSRFVKNLSSDKITLSTLKGEGELCNLELEEEVLTELLALPTWMKLTHAHCNRVLIRIQWTKLKSVPIHLSLDEVCIRVEACEILRTGTNPDDLAFPSLGKYGFVNKVIDGITATVNSVEITFHSQAFESKVQISRIRVESKSPEWRKAELSGTRLKDLNKGETLIFKEMEWQTLRLEARSTTELHLAPLRLLANQAKARIVMKKKLSDCQVVGCRLSLILDDLLWVLTDSQILAALHFMSSLSGLVKQATEMTQKVKAARKLTSLPEYQAQLIQTSAMQQQQKHFNPTTIDAQIKKFDAFDVTETSYHFICEKIDLHFCDDPGSGRSQHPDLKEGGALQLSLNQVMVDFYPYHLAVGTRKSWPRYSESCALSQWLKQAIQGFRISLIDTLSSTSMHPPLTRIQNQQQTSSSPSSSTTTDNSSQIRQRVTEQLAKLMSTCLILKIQDMRLFKVTTSSKRESPQPFLSTFINRPKDQDLPVIHTEFSWFYYPGEMCFPLPSPKIYSHLHPIQIHLDICTILWLNAFITNLQHSMAITAKASPEVQAEEEADYVDVRVELIMPKVVFENKTFYPSAQKERPNSLHFQVSRMILSNYRSVDTGTMHQLTQCLELLQRGDLVYGTDFPSKPEDQTLCNEKFIKHAEGQDKIRALKKLKCNSFQEISTELTKDMLWTDARDVWYISMDPFWAEFHIDIKKKPDSSQSANNKRQSSSGGKGFSRNATLDDSCTKSAIIYPFIDSIPLTIWIYPTQENQEEGQSQSKEKKKKLQAIFSTSGICKVQLNHYQFLFLMRMAEALGELSLFITLDAKQIIGKEVLQNLVTFLGCLTSIEVTLLFPHPILKEDEEEEEESNNKQDSQSIDTNNSLLLQPESIISGEIGIPSTEPQTPERPKPHLPHLSEHGTGSNTTPMTVSLSTPALVSAPGSLTRSSPLNLNFGGSNPALENIRSSLTHSMKHGYSNLAVSFNKCGPGLGGSGSGVAGISTPDSEIASNWSNFSSESSSENNFVTLDVIDSHSQHSSSAPNNNNEDADDDDDVEIATEVNEEHDFTNEERETTPSPSLYQNNNEHNTFQRPERDLTVSVLTAQLDGVEIAQEGKGLGSVIKLQCKSINLKESTGMPWTEFQAKFSARTRTWPEDSNITLGNSNNCSPTQKRALKLRLNQEIDENIFQRELTCESTTQEFKLLKQAGYPRVNLTDRPGATSPIRNFILQSTFVTLDGRIDLRNEDKFKLHMSVVTALADFVEDEILPVPFPLQLELVGINLEMIEDRPPANITSPGSLPICVTIPDVLPITRDKHGVFHIGQRSSATATTTTAADEVNTMGNSHHHSSSGSSSQRTKSDIDLLQGDLEKSIKQLDLAQKKNATLETELECIPDLKLMILQLQEQVTKLQEEKSTHLRLLRMYQNQQK